MNGKTEVVLDDGTRVDIVTDTFAIEVDFAEKWAESIGQSLHYANKLNKKAGILLLIDNNKDDKFIKILMPIANKYNITVWLMNHNNDNWKRVIIKTTYEY